ncbi:uncharacterized protein LOC107274496, partial [Cephus cinctus]|uniref:ATP-dependent DNA helicase n=1 Tax=Cephus cinctus TaxID=211228 RepID=A0AAJ7CEY1_CEPCN
MAHKHSLEALNRTLKGDFRQILPVIPRSTYADEINACLKSSSLWSNVKKVQLNINMRVQMLEDPSAETFSNQLLDIGDGKVAVYESTGCIKLPTNFCAIVDSQNTLINSIFPDVRTEYINHAWLAERAILAAKNVGVHDLNFKIQQSLPGDFVSYKSIDTVCDANEAVNYPTEFFNSLDLPGMSPHLLRLKVGSPNNVRGAHLGCRTNKATNMRNSRAERTDEQIQQDNEIMRVSMSQLRASQSQEARAERNQQRQLERRQARQMTDNANKYIENLHPLRPFVSHS